MLPAQQPAIVLDKNDPELRAVLTEIEGDAEKARVKEKIPGLSIVIVHDQDVLLPRRWVVERSFGWMSRFRRLARDYERLPETLAGLHYLAFVILMLKNVAEILA